MSAFATLWEELLDLHDSFLNEAVAAPFVTHKRSDFDQQPVRVMLVGKATRGDWFQGSYDEAYSCSLGDRIRERQRVYREHLASEAEKDASDVPNFWNFAKRVSEIAGNGGRPLCNLAWSNVCKLGSLVGNPSRHLYEEQVDLCSRILAAEIENYDPHVLLCVNANFGKTILLRALDAPNEQLWVRSEDDPASGVSDVWRLQLTTGRHVIWSRHPERMPATKREYIYAQFAQIVKELT